MAISRKKIDEQFARLQGKEQDLTTVELVDANTVKIRKIDIGEDDKEKRQQNLDRKREVQAIEKKKNEIKKFVGKLKLFGAIIGILSTILLVIAILTPNWKNCKGGSGTNFNEGLFHRCTKGNCIANDGVAISKYIDNTSQGAEKCGNETDTDGWFTDSDGSCEVGYLCEAGLIQKEKMKICTNNEYFNKYTGDCQTKKIEGCKDSRCPKGGMDDSETKYYKDASGDGCKDFFYCKDRVSYSGSCLKGDYFNETSGKCQLQDKNTPKECSENSVKWCAGRNDIQKYYVHNKACRTYYRCVDEKYEGSECPIGQVFDLSDNTCKDSITNTVAGCLAGFNMDMTNDYSKAEHVDNAMGLKKYGRYSDNGTYIPWIRIKEHFSACMWVKYNGPDGYLGHDGVSNGCFRKRHWETDMGVPKYGFPLMTGVTQAGREYGGHFTECYSGISLFNVESNDIEYSNFKSASYPINFIHMQIAMTEGYPWVLYDSLWTRRVSGSKLMTSFNARSYYVLNNCELKDKCADVGCDCDFPFSGMAMTVPYWAYYFGNSTDYKVKENQWNHICATIDEQAVKDGKSGKMVKLWTNGKKTERFVTPEMAAASYTKDDEKNYDENKNPDELGKLTHNNHHHTIRLGYGSFLSRMERSEEPFKEAIWKGKVRGVYMWNRTITDKEVESMYTAANATTTTNPDGRPSDKNIPNDNLVLDWEEYRDKYKNGVDIKQEPEESKAQDAADLMFQGSDECKKAIWQPGERVIFPSPVGQKHTNIDAKKDLQAESCTSYEKCTYYSSIPNSKCPDGQQANTNTLTCTEETPATCHDPDCIKEKNFQYPAEQSCKSYYKCQKSNLYSDENVGFFQKTKSYCSEPKPYFSKEDQECMRNRVDTLNCPDITVYSDWGNWGECKQGSADRTRTCQKHVPNSKNIETLPTDCYDKNLGSDTESKKCGGSDGKWLGTVTAMAILALVATIIGVGSGFLSYAFKNSLLNFVAAGSCVLSTLLSIVAPIIFRGTKFHDCSMNMDMSAKMFISCCPLGIICCGLYAWAQMKTKEHNNIIVPVLDEEDYCKEDAM